MSSGNWPAVPRAIPLSVASLIVLGACSDPPAGPSPADRPQSSDRSSRSTLQHPGEAAFEQISKAVPSFAGYHLDKGNLVVSVTDPNASQAAQTAVQQVFAATIPAKAAQRFSKPPMIGRHSQYSFIQLRDWRDQIEEGVFLALDDASSIDLDEVANQVVVGLATGSGRGDVEQWLVRAGIPASAVKIQIVPRIVPHTPYLTDYVRPVIGGLQVSTSQWLCTLGFNGQYQGINVVLTNSHCTSTIFGADSPPTAFYQGGSFIGNEYYDPPGVWRSGVFYGRYSDAAMIAYASGVSFELASIARPLSHSDTWGVAGSTEINASNPHFNITGEQLYPAAGNYVDKVGYRTGWTRGRLNSTCVDEHATDGFWRFCSDEAAYFSDHGDSGSPVFMDPGDGNSITLVGINWGAGDGHAVFSPLGGIRQEFGFIKTFNPPLVASMTGASTVRPNVTCTWTASATGGTYPYTYTWRRNSVTVGSSYIYTANTGTSSFYLQVTVTDAAGGASQAAKTVTVSSSAPVC